MKAGKQIDTIYNDFKRAFDRVAHWLLNAKIEALGVGPPQDWLVDRIREITLRVKIRKELSGDFKMKSGISIALNDLFICFVEMSDLESQHFTIVEFLDDENSAG
ncbi:hypothetical protein WA026_009313 [Henosepilachna vigintioctopunctata]|uniref:Uncharacterized protein n=1 Tax=Henosepilachna vigintioctopunctata TaxID=420089 RepID=A0AAW1UZT7_9CUCU